MSNELKEWQEKEFNEALGSNNVSVVEFGAKWCGACKATEPVLAQMSETYTDITFAKIDVSKNANLASKMGVMSLPNILIISGGKVVEQIIGGANQNKIEEKLRKFTKV